MASPPRHPLDQDDLTGLANAKVLLRLLQEQLDTGRGVSALVYQLDGLADLNARFGRDEVDRLLHAVAERLRAAVSGLDAMVGRPGGVRFVCLCATDDAPLVVTALEHAFRSPFAIADETTMLTVSSGVGESRDGITAEPVLAAADRRMGQRGVIDLTERAHVAPHPASSPPGG